MGVAGSVISGVYVVNPTLVGIGSQHSPSIPTPAPFVDQQLNLQQPTNNQPTNNVDHNTCNFDNHISVDDLSLECQVLYELVGQLDDIDVPSMNDIQEQLMLHHYSVDETVQYFLKRDQYLESFNFKITFGKLFNGFTGGWFGGGNNGGGGGGGDGGGGRSTIPFIPSPPSVDEAFISYIESEEFNQHQMRLGIDSEYLRQHMEAVDLPQFMIEMEADRAWNELVNQQASLLADYHGPHYIHPNWEEHANEDDMRIAHDPVFAQDRAEINELVDVLAEVEVEMAQREVDFLYGVAQQVVAHNQMCLDLVHDLAQQTIAFNEVRYENPWRVGVQDQQEGKSHVECVHCFLVLTLLYNIF